MTWANPGSSLMAYLQCKEEAPSDHSFVYFRDDITEDWKFVGNGFDFGTDAMPDTDFDELVEDSGVPTTCHHANIKVNVFGTPLEECRTTLEPDDTGGSWQDDGTCSEQVGGIHEICIEALPADFSSETHQSPWSKDRAGKRHCVCIGAWSLYMTEAAKHAKNAAKIMPHCKAIPETALTVRYLDNWKTWQGFPANIVMGVSELVTRCLISVNSTQPHAHQLQCGLKHRFELLEKKVTALQKSPVLKDLRKRLTSLTCTHEEL